MKAQCPAECALCPKCGDTHIKFGYINYLMEVGLRCPECRTYFEAVAKDEWIVPGLEIPLDEVSSVIRLKGKLQ